MSLTCVPELTDEQEVAMAAIDAFMADPARQVFNLHGLAGTGKTTVLAHIAHQYRHAAICSLTGKAASVLRRRTGLNAQTLHSVFYRLRETTKDKRGKLQLHFERQHRDDDLADELALLDESSMINEEIGRDVLAAGCKIIAAGDPGQLPPVTGRQYFAPADFTLQEIHRQALESPIIRQAHAVRVGGTYAADGAGFRVGRDEIPDDDLRAADVVLCFTNRTKDRLNSTCRAVRGIWQRHPQAGEPVTCLKNAGQYGVFNGGTYTLVRPFMENDSFITLDVDGRVVTIPNVQFRGITSPIHPSMEPTTTFDFGYASTVHKAQGSEWPFVILVDEYRRHEQRREWLYTGITRAAERILVVR